MAIKRLPDEVMSRIAAGEVITSPYNIVKELLENSLDAGASHIAITIDSALQRITIRDNGHGIAKEDLEYLCMNHYTSKTESMDDLRKHGSIASGSSFGFRGEALHSMSLCGHVKVQTRTASDEDDIGHLATYRDDRLDDLRRCAFEGCGALVEIDDIFYNSPIRADHYRRNKSELMGCIGLVSHYGVIHGGIECRVDGKVVIAKDFSLRKIEWDKPDCPDVTEKRKAYIFTHILSAKGLSSPESLKSLTRHLEDGSNEGFQIICTEPNTSLKSAYFVLFVNRRLVKNETLRRSILQRYRAVRKTCNPFVFIELYVEDVDVNVHPSKAEVLVGCESVFQTVLRGFDTIFSESVEIGATVSESVCDATMPSSIPVSMCNTAHAPAPAYVRPIFSIPKTPPHSPLKIYSSPFVRQLSELQSQPELPQRSLSLTSLRTLLAELREIDPLFLQSLVFVGVFENSIYAQHHTNLLRADKAGFLFNVFYQKILREFGCVGCREVKDSVEMRVDSGLWELLREYFGVNIEDGKLIALPLIYDVEPETPCSDLAGGMTNISRCFEDFVVEKTDEISTIRSIAVRIAEIYSRIEITSGLFNKMKTETTATVEIVESLALLTGLRDMYKTFDRC